MSTVMMFSLISGNRIRCTSTDAAEFLRWLANREHVTRRIAEAIRTNDSCHIGELVDKQVDEWYREQIENEPGNGKASA